MEKLAVPDIPGMSDALWDTIPLAVQAIIIALHTANLQMREELRVLQARLDQDSSNSSKPPSSDRWWKNANKKKGKAGKKPGAQPGHLGHHRPMVPLEKVDEILPYFPGQCEHCGDALQAEDNVNDEPERHQVSELPAVKATVTEHQLHRRKCKSCGKISKAKISPRITGSSFGPRMQAEIVHLIANCKLPRCGTQLGGVDFTLGHALSFLHQQVFVLWHRFKSGEIDRTVFDAELAPLRKSMENSLEQGSRGQHKKIAGMCADILRHWPAIWNFTLVDGMEPTNNAAERAHRQAVKWRKMSFGTRSAGGSRFVERMLTVAETCRQNQRNVLDYLVQTITAATLNQPPPRLISLPSHTN